MLIEWIKTLKHYFEKSKSVLAKDINGKPYSKLSKIFYVLSFWVLACIVVLLLPKGLSDGFIDYIKDIFAIFVGFFVTVLCFVFDKLDIEHIPSTKEEDDKKAEDRLDSITKLNIKHEHNYTVRFFYTIGLIILFSTLVILLLIPNIFWGNWFSMNVREYEFVSSWDSISWSAICTFLHLAFCVVYRIVVVLLTIKVFYFTTYSVCSLLQVLINKKKLETWS